MEAFQHAKQTTVVDLDALLDACEDAVVTLVAGHTRLVAHRAVLMDRSPVFCSMFQHDTVEASSDQVTITDMEGPVLRQLLSHLYKLRARQLPDMLAPAAGSSRQVWGGRSQDGALRRIITTMEAIQLAKETTAMDLGALLDACDGAMVTLVAGHTRLVAHRAVLVDRSPVFAAMFRHDTLESRSGQVTIVDVEGPVLRQLLSYMYTLQAPQLPDTLIQQLAAADKYGVDGLKVACEQQVASQLSVEKAAAVAVLAVRYSCESLRQASIAFLMDHTHQVMATRGWADAIRSQPDDVIEVKKLLVAEMRGLHAVNKGRMFSEAAKNGAVGEMEMLWAAGADVAATDVHRWTALHWAAREGHVEAARWLIARGAPLDARGSWDATPLHVAADFGLAAVARLLLAASADHGARNKSGYTPLHCAASSGYTDIVAALLQAGADRKARDNFGNTPLDLARMRPCSLETMSLCSKLK